MTQKTIYDTLELGSKQTELVAALFFYLFGLVPRAQFVAYCGDPALSRRLIRTALKSGYLLKQCKLYAYAEHKQGKKQQIQLQDYGVTRKDANFLQRLNLKKLKSVVPVYTVPQYDEVVTKIVGSKTLRNFTNAFIYKNLRFLMNSYGTSRDDLFGQLQFDATYALYKQFPKYDSALHMLNICKTVIHNQGWGIAGYNNKQKRKALRETKNGFESVNLPIEFAYDLATQENDVKNHFATLSQLEKKMSPRVHNFLRLATGQYDEIFSTHIGQSNCDLVDEISYEKYMSKVRDFIGITEQQQNELYEKLRGHLL